ncbi:DinB family protein [Marininema halotolerans]|uniref:DinB superfamily protein n=1 Tax=Marininema halotolerans TaxID=1155944 RepID=A0A1I6TKE3_9BACL|nr:DinB family protein [Marininema halotolerans]SFS89655.1 Protein of unknown function [Marininema halotolerans]
MDLGTVFLQQAIQLLQAQKKKGEDALNQITEDELTLRTHEDGNSMAILIQHLAGNMKTRWADFLEGDMEKPSRDRDGEFEEQALSQAALMHAWEQGWNTIITTLQSLPSDQLLATVTLRGEPRTVLLAIQNELTHYSYHIGQMVALARWIRGSQWKNLSIPKKEVNTG